MLVGFNESLSQKWNGVELEFTFLSVVFIHVVSAYMLQGTLRSNLNFESTFDIFKSDALGCHQPAVLINCERLFNKFPTLGTCWNSHKIKMKTQKTNINRLFITTTPPEM